MNCGKSGRSGFSGWKVEPGAAVGVMCCPVGSRVPVRPPPESPLPASDDGIVESGTLPSGPGPLMLSSLLHAAIQVLDPVQIRPNARVPMVRVRMALFSPRLAESKGVSNPDATHHGR